MTLWTVGHSKLFRAALAERSLSNFVSFMGTSDSGWIWNRIAGAFPEDDVQKLWDMSPIKYVADIQIPVLVMHSERDDRTPIEQGEQIFLALRRLGRDTKLIMFPEESHGLSRGGKPSRRVERLGYVLEWFREKL
jgi:dipeptidyl aminopeptidase/acylaminoacyl peptidase